jgi:hypothetical protein
LGVWKAICHESFATDPPTEVLGSQCEYFGEVDGIIIERMGLLASMAGPAPAIKPAV